jgi:hypothetical protein
MSSVGRDSRCRVPGVGKGLWDATKAYHETEGITPHTLHPSPYTLHPTPYTLHPTPYTLHPTPYTTHPSPFTLHHTPYTLHPTPYTLNSTRADLPSESRAYFRLYCSGFRVWGFVKEVCKATRVYRGSFLL